MAFKRTTTPTFRAEVKVNVANEQGGYDENTFTAIFKRADTEEQKSLRLMANEALIKRQLVGWEMQDAETGEQVPFTAENLQAAMLISPTPYAIATAFWEQISGARAKNS